MTREEAFKKLEQTIGLYLMSGNADDTYCGEWRKILETLKSELCGDCISRAEMKKAIIEHQYSSKFCVEHHIDHSINTNMALIALSELPPVQPKPKTPKTGWIPVSESLPEEAFGCIVTVWDTNPMTMNEFENILPYFVGWDGKQWNDADGEQCPFEVIAWMPLPKPYKEG